MLGTNIMIGEILSDFSAIFFYKTAEIRRNKTPAEIARYTVFLLANTICFLEEMILFRGVSEEGKEHHQSCSFLYK